MIIKFKGNTYKTIDRPTFQTDWDNDEHRWVVWFDAYAIREGDKPNENGDVPTYVIHWDVDIPAEKCFECDETNTFFDRDAILEPTNVFDGYAWYKASNRLIYG